MSRLAALALLATCSIVAANSAAPTRRRPNILMLAVDDLRPLFGRAYDSPQQRTTVVKTPNLDRFLECASPRQASPLPGPAPAFCHHRSHPLLAVAQRGAGVPKQLRPGCRVRPQPLVPHDRPPPRLHPHQR